MMRQTREAMVRTMGVKIQAKRPSLPILTVVVCVKIDQVTQGKGVKVDRCNGPRRLELGRYVKRVNLKSVDGCSKYLQRRRE